MQLFYFKDINENSTSFIFDKEESKHIIKVLRKKEGDILMVTNGLGFLFETKISIASDSKCTVEIVSFQQQKATDYYLHMVVAPTKMNERLEWFLEKATEIGLHEFTPIICEHSERKVLKTDRLEKILLSAMKQSNQCYLPKINEPISFKNFIQMEEKGQKFIAHCEETQKLTFASQIHPGEKCTVLIGPEGDFSTQEIKLALENKFIPVSLGNNRLRTETAALVACHTVVLKNEQ
ncbi:16S rRNA (uracil(1498)-N(3))-methyltransferase [Flavobacterium filum]|uniref:16S rRNA (uracil(1498)-N(3))-methyltransferase n=1 Tax=Flavobacterium TaxID=237 RepID=UPI0003FD40B2|nr:16S rRNA (uracil(1498)-N(3))-methyltransferase [Flavobacterium filum]